jgi:hypothetical protein
MPRNDHKFYFYRETITLVREFVRPTVSHNLDLEIHVTWLADVKTYLSLST